MSNVSLLEDQPMCNEPDRDFEIIDLIGKEKYELKGFKSLPKYELLLVKCLPALSFTRSKHRLEYLRNAIPNGFQKKILIFNGEIVGTIEYAPPAFSCYPIQGEKIAVMNCVWVLRKAKGHGFGKELVRSMIEDSGDVDGFATIALEKHWSPWFRKWQIEKLGFKPIDSMKVKHKVKRTSKLFKLHLMWLPTNQDAELPTWDKVKMTEGVKFCRGHPLYNTDSWETKHIVEEVPV